VEVNGLREGLKQLTDAWAIMMRRVPFKHALGSLRSQEFTMKNGEFHPHVHAVVIAADLAQAEKMRTLLLEKFQGAAGLTYTPHCYRKGFFAVSSGCDVSGLLRYVLERPEVPVMEALIADREVYTRFHSALLGRRLISATGCFRKSAASKRTASAGTSGSSLVN